VLMSSDQAVAIITALVALIAALTQLIRVVRGYHSEVAERLDALLMMIENGDQSKPKVRAENSHAPQP
jgi:hypothetical protein